MTLERIKEYIDNMSLTRLTPEELKTITECVILIERYNDDKAIKENVSNELNGFKLKRV